MTLVLGERRQQKWPSTVAHLSRLVLHLHHVLGVLDEKGYPNQEMVILESPRSKEPALMKGTECRECGNMTVIRKDGCDFCCACGWMGTCG